VSRTGARAFVAAAIACGVLLSVSSARADRLETFRVRLRAESPGTSYHLRVAGERDTWLRMCEAPCVLDLPAGPGFIGVSVGDSAVLRAAIDVRPDLKLVARHASRRGWRTAGVAALVVTGLAASYVANQTDPRSPYGHYGPAFSIGIAGTLVALPMLAQRDRVTLVPASN
jgi:hypothetical protein